MGDHPEPISPERERGEKNRAHGSNGKDGWIGEALERNLCKLNHCAVSSLKYISLSPWRVTLNLNERILKLWRSNWSFGTKVGESDFFTASGGFMGILPGFKSSPSSPTLHATFNSSLLLKSCLTNLRIKMFISTSNPKWNIRIIRPIDFEIWTSF